MRKNPGEPGGIARTDTSERIAPRVDRLIRSHPEISRLAEVERGDDDAMTKTSSG